MLGKIRNVGRKVILVSVVLTGVSMASAAHAIVVNGTPYASYFSLARAICAYFGVPDNSGSCD